MNPSAFSKITGALVQLLEAEPPIADAVYRARSRVVPQSISRAINVQFDGSMPSPGVIDGAPVDWTSTFSVECFARAATSENNDEAVDPLLMAVYSRVAADTTLGGLVDNVGEPRIEAEYSADGERTGWVRMTYPIEHRTEQSTLE
jgi:hypothetical protein